MPSSGRTRTWRRGFFRLWVLVSVLWVFATTNMMASNMDIAWEPDPMIHVKFSNTEIWDYPVDWGMARIRASVKERVAEANAKFRADVAAIPASRREECRKIDPKVLVVDMPKECLDLETDELFHLSAFALPSGWESQLTHRPLSIPQATIAIMPWAAGPPLLVLLLGAALAWVIRGFYAKIR